MSIYEGGGIVLYEGVGGCGKGTQIELLTGPFKRRGIDVISVREPGGAPDAEKIRDYIFRNRQSLSAERQIELFFKARRILWEQRIMPHVNAGGVAILDRSAPSTYAYQGCGEDGNVNYITELAGNFYSSLRRPDVTFLLRISAETMQARRGSNYNGDPFDSETVAYQQRVVEGYGVMCNTNWCGLNWKEVDGEQSVQRVHQQILDILNE